VFSAGAVFSAGGASEFMWKARWRQGRESSPQM